MEERAGQVLTPTVAGFDRQAVSERPLAAYGFWTDRVISGKWLFSLVAAAYLGLFLVTVVRFPLLSSVATVDEQLIYYQTARNFVTYGFLNSGFLHDLSTSSNPGEHPYIYNHMPPGPEIFTALLFKLFGERYALIRLVFAGVFLAGIVCFLRFAGLILRGHGLTGEGFAILFLSPYTVLHAIDHPAYSSFPFLAFFPVVALHAYYETGRRIYYALALLVVFVASMYAVTLNFVLFLAAWALLYLLGLLRIDLRHLVTFVAVGCAGVLLHLLQGLLFLGPSVFLEELRVTFSNRIFGAPSAEGVMAFYRSHDIVLHGTHHFDPFRLLVSINNSLRFPGRFFFVLLAILVIAWTAVRIGRSDRTIAFLVKLGLWAAGTILVPLLVFPAYTADYGLQGLNEFVLAIGATALGSYVMRELVWSGAIRGARPLEVVVAVALVASLLAVGRTQAGNVTVIVPREVGPNPYADLAKIGEQLRGKVAMTNIYPTVVGFFTREAAFGGCEMPVFKADGRTDPSKCHAAWIRGYGRTARITPTHYVLFRAPSLFTGFTRCVGECLDQLYEQVARTHVKVSENRLFTIFALRES